MSTARRVDLFDLAATPDPESVRAADTELIETDDDLIDVTAGECCHGGELRLWCKLCPSSPTYWRRDDGP